MSKFGYIFIALGSAAWSASIFHLMTPAFFLAPLSLTTGALILARHHEQDISTMGILRTQLPLEHTCFLVGGLAIAAFPWITPGYYRKDAILWELYAGGHAGVFLAELVGAVLTSPYIFWVICTMFLSEARIQAYHRRGVTYWLPLAVLLVFSALIDVMIHPPLAGMLPAMSKHTADGAKLEVGMLSGAIALSGSAVGYRMFLWQQRLVDWLNDTVPGRVVNQWWLHGARFDWLYDRLLVQPLVWFSSVNVRDSVDVAILVVPSVLRALNGALVRTENGRIYWYAAGLSVAAALVIAVALL